MSEPTLQDCINYMRSQIKQMEKHPRNYEFNLPYYRKTVELLEKAERPHGEWKQKSGLYFGYPYCSKCGYAYKHAFNFCPNCGADMREEGDRNDNL